MERQITKTQALELVVKVVDKAIEDKTFIDTDLFDLVDIELLDKLQAMLTQQKKQDSAKREKKTKSKTSLEKEKDISLIKDFYSSLEDKEVFSHGGRLS